MYKLSLPKGFVFFAVTVCLLLFIMEIVNHRFWLNDFKVYYESAYALFHGLQVYNISRGLDFAFYKYSPFILFFYFPFLIFKFKIAAAIYYLLMIGFMIGIFILLKRLLSRHLFDNKLFTTSIPFILVYLFTSLHIYRELHLGNTNIILVMLLLLALDSMLTDKLIRGGILLALVVLFKPYLVVLLLPVVMHRKWKSIASFAASLVLQFLIMILVWGPSKTMLLHSDWITTILNHSSNYTSNNSLDYLFNFYLGITNIRYLNFIGLISICILYLVFYFANRRRALFSPDLSLDANNYLLIEFLLFMAVIPNIINTDSVHFLFSIPVISILVLYVYGKGNFILKALLFVIFIFFGTNTNDLVGKTIGAFFDKIASIGISNLALLVFILIVLYTGLPKRFKALKNNQMNENSSDMLK